MDFKGILTPILRSRVQKSTLLLQNRRHAEVLKEDHSFREIRNAGVPPPGALIIKIVRSSAPKLLAP